MMLAAHNVAGVDGAQLAGGHAVRRRMKRSSTVSVWVENSPRLGPNPSRFRMDKGIARFACCALTCV
jgi:hypothetical protein